MKKLIPYILSVLIFAAGVAYLTQDKEELGATRTFTSSQLATSPQSDYVLYSDGANNYWASAAAGSSEWTDAGDYVYPNEGDYISGPYIVATSTTASSTLPILRTNYIEFDQTVDYTPLIGELTWDILDGTLALGLNGGDTKLQIGQENVRYVKAAEAITNGDVVYASGVVGNSGAVEVSQYTADGSVHPRYIFGIATEDISINDWGYITTDGKVRGIDTTGSYVGETWASTTVLYASTTGAGKLTGTEPTAPDLRVPIAFVTTVNPANGIIEVRYPDTYYLRDLHDVYRTAETDRDALLWSSSNSRWENRAIVEADISDLGAYLTTVDISDNTNLTVTSPITLTGDDIGLNQTAITQLGTITTGVWNGTAIDISSYTNLVAGTNITLAGDTLNVDDSFLLNTGDIGTGVFDFGGASSFEIVNGANPTVNAVGEIAFNTSNNALSIATSSTFAELPIYPPVGFAYASTSWTGTSTPSNYPTSPTFGEDFLPGVCNADGSAVIRIGDGTNWSNAVALSSGTTSVSFTSNKTFDKGGEVVTFQIGSPSGVTYVSCKFDRVYTR